MVKTLIGTATTDNRGECSIEYTGNGNGLIQIQAENNDGSLKSPVITIYDSLIKDIGKKANNNKNIWKDAEVVYWDFPIRTNIILKDSFSLVTTTSNFGRLFCDYMLPSRCAIEFDVYVSYTTVKDVFCSLRLDDTTARNISVDNASITKNNTWSHIKIVIDGRNVVVNDVKSFTASRDINHFYFTPYQVNLLRFRNFCIYEV